MHYFKITYQPYTYIIRTVLSIANSRSTDIITNSISNRSCYIVLRNLRLIALSSDNVFSYELFTSYAFGGKKGRPSKVDVFLFPAVYSCTYMN